MSERRYFERDTNYKEKTGFSRVKFGIDKPILEVELNEMQKIQEEKRNSITRQTVPSGFLELKRRDFEGEDIIYNPTTTKYTFDINDNNKIIDTTYEKQYNTIAIPPCKLIVNGFEVDLEGDTEIDGIKGYTLIELKDAPNVSNNNEFFDFVFLEVWFQEIGMSTTVYENGFLHGNVLDNVIIDDRVGGETSRRVSLRCRIRTEKTIDSKKWPDGFGYNEITDEYSSIYAQGPLNDVIRAKECIFLSATSSKFKGKEFYNDFGLYVAGRTDYVDSDGKNKMNSQFGILDEYIFAIPMFKIKRRNSKPYSISNPNGGIPHYPPKYVVSDRPDGLFNNLIDKRDVIDARKTISFNQLSANKLLDENLKKIMIGNLNTNSNDKMVRAQFGLPNLNSVSPDYLSSAVLHLDFTNRTLVPKIGIAPVVLGGNDSYHLSALGYGLSLDGTNSFKYSLTTFDKNKGSIEFLLKPYWDGADKDISQNILSIVDASDMPLMSLAKDKDSLTLIQYQDGNPNTNINKTAVNLTNENLYNNEIYHVRFCWSFNNSYIIIYINGKKVAHTNYLISSLTPNSLKLGNIELVGSYSPAFTGCVIDELVIYNKVLGENNFEQINLDVTYGEAKIYNSFNGVLRGFQDNDHEQTVINVIATTSNSTSFEIESPYGTQISTDGAKVYSRTTGEEYTGTWTKLSDNSSKFDLTLTPTLTNKFSGEVVWITHKIIQPGGLGIKEVPNKILKAELNGGDVSFANFSTGERKVENVEDETLHVDYIQIKSKEVYDYSSKTKDASNAFARLLKCVVKSNGTNTYRIPKKLIDRDVIGIVSIGKPVSSIYKDSSGDIVVRLIDKLLFSDEFTLEIALGGFLFDYQTHTKSLVSNMMKASTIRIPADGNTDEYVIPGSLAISSSVATNPNGGIIVSLLNTKYKDNSNNMIDMGTTVFVSGPTVNSFSKATVSGVGTPFVKIKFNETPPVDHFIDIPVLITYQPRSAEVLSIWYEYTPYQGILNSNESRKLKRISDWKCFVTTFGSGKIVAKNIEEKSINNASNRLPGGMNFSYLLDGKDINFVGEQITSTGSYAPNKKLVFRSQFLELVNNNEFDAFFNSLGTEFTIRKEYGRNYQDAFIEFSENEVGFVIQDTQEAINKYLGAACIVADERGNLMLFIAGEVTKQPTISSIIKFSHGDLFKLEKNPIIIPRND